MIRSRLIGNRSVVRGMLGSALFVGSFGAPSACIELPVADVNKAPGADTASTSTATNPVFAKRDNIGVYGKMIVNDSTVTGISTNAYASDGSWKNLDGYYSALETRSDGSIYNRQYTPILPAPNQGLFEGPGSAAHATRSMTMVHGNTYRVTMSAKAVNGTVEVPKEVFIKLDPAVKVVPVVIVSWRDPVFTEFQEYRYLGRNMIDFNPYHMPKYPWPAGSLPLLVDSPVAASEIRTPNPTYFKNMPPNAAETPPDEIWAQCGVQFQVVAQFTFDTPPSRRYDCNKNGYNFANPTDIDQLIRDKLAATPLLASYLVDELRPVVLQYGPLNCAEFSGTAYGKGRYVEMDHQRASNGTAHELGHVLGLDDLDSGSVPKLGENVNDNLMRYASSNKLTAQQCSAVQLRADLLSDAYDLFNIRIGRVYGQAPPFNPADLEPDPFDPGMPETQQKCCLGATDVYKADQCAGAEVAAELCAENCCSTDPYHQSTAYACKQSGGVPQNCWSK